MLARRSCGGRLRTVWMDDDIDTLRFSIL